MLKSMNKESTIFIAMPTLYDTETILTVQNAFSAANNPDKIFFGIACTSDKSFYDTLSSAFSENANVRMSWNQPGDGIGVGLGRNRAISMYDGEEYILQIDSHTYFRSGWDDEVKTMWTEASKETNNPKTIVTCYLPLYKNTINEGRVPKDFISTYPRFTRQLNVNAPGVPNMANTRISEFPEHIASEYVDKTYFPATKISAHFSIGNHLWAENYGLPEDVVFWEEEIIQTINLMGDGFSLVFPNKEVPLCHLYFDDVKTYNPFSISERSTIRSMMQLVGIEDNKPFIENYNKFINDPENKDKLEKFYIWSKVHPKYGPAKEFYIPKTYTL